MPLATCAATRAGSTVGPRGTSANPYAPEKVNNAAPTGLLVVATVQSYPDVATNAAGTGTSSRVITAALDSLTAYSVRIRPSQTATNWNGTSPTACGNLQRSQGG